MKYIVPILFAILLSTPALADKTERVRFQPGSSGTTIKDAVVRGDRHVYLLGAGAGQSMKVKIYSIENNAVFQVKGPGGSYLAGAAEGEDATFWEGRLPADGDYKIIVGGTRGNATYTLRVDIQ